MHSGSLAVACSAANVHGSACCSCHRQNLTELKCGLFASTAGDLDFQRDISESSWP